MKKAKFVTGMVFFLFSNLGHCDYFIFKDQVGSATKSLLEWNQISGDRPATDHSYNRKADFGSWVAQKKIDSCLNTRGVVLKNFSLAPVEKKPGSCTILAGKWLDPYSGTVFENSKDIQIDHMVPLKNAFLSGASTWTGKVRCLFANFLGNKFHLLPVSGHENQSKGDRGPDQYLPPNKAHVCDYLKNWLTIKFTWNLNMTQAEGHRISDEIIKNKCPRSKYEISETELQQDLQFKEENKNLCASF